MAKKLSTAEILAKARADAAKKAGDSSEPEADAAAQQPKAEEQSAPESPPSDAPAAAPKSTADILAAARAQAAGKSADAGGEEAAPAAPPAGDAPKSTKDILAAARAQAGGGAKPAAAPSSTKDILAAARAQAGGGAAAAPAAKEGGAKAAPKSAPAAAASGEKLSVQEMLARVREGKPTAAPAAPAKPTLPPRPKKPAAAGKKGKAADADRRFWLVALLLSPFAMGWFLFSVASAAFTLALARFMMPNVLIEPPSQFKIGPPSDYPPDTVETKWKAQYGVWIVNTFFNGNRMIYALSSVCTHLGCTPNWLEGEQKFKCPCHGSGFYINGINFEGPAPRPLERVGIQIAPDGMLEVDKSVKFQEEMGQWSDPKSFVPVA